MDYELSRVPINILYVLRTENAEELDRKVNFNMMQLGPQVDWGKIQQTSECKKRCGGGADLSILILFMIRLARRTATALDRTVQAFSMNLFLDHPQPDHKPVDLVFSFKREPTPAAEMNYFAEYRRHFGVSQQELNEWDLRIRFYHKRGEQGLQELDPGRREVKHVFAIDPDEGGLIHLPKVYDYVHNSNFIELDQILESEYSRLRIMLSFGNGQDNDFRFWDPSRQITVRFQAFASADVQAAARKGQFKNLRGQGAPRLIKNVDLPMQAAFRWHPLSTHQSLKEKRMTSNPSEEAGAALQATPLSGPGTVLLPETFESNLPKAAAAEVLAPSEGQRSPSRLFTDDSLLPPLPAVASPGTRAAEHSD